MRTYLVVIEPPAFDGFARVVEGEEPVFIQTFLAELAVEAFWIAVLRWSARSDEVQPHVVFVSPLIERFRGEFRPLSTMICSGNPRSMRSCSSTRITRKAGNEVSTSMASISRVKASSIDRVRSLRLHARAS